MRKVVFLLAFLVLIWAADSWAAVNVASGNLRESVVLFRLPQGKLSSDFVLTYNSLDGKAGPLGMGWTHSYDIRLNQNNNGSYTLVERDGSRLVLYKNGERYTPKNSTYPFLILNQDGTSVLEKKEGTFHDFGPAGQLVRIRDRNGNQVTLEYDQENLVRVTDPEGRVIAFSNSGNRISTITDPMGNVHTITYGDAEGNLTSISSQVVGLGTRIWAFAYYPNGFLWTKTDPMGNKTEYFYDDQYRAAKVIDPEGRTREVIYDPAQSQTQLKEKDGGVWVYRFDSSLGVLTEKTDPLGNRWVYTHYSNGYLKSVTAPRGFTTSYTYDGSGNMTSSTDALGSTTTYTYNSLNKVTSITYPGGALVTMSYDSKGNLLAVTDPLGNQTRFAYDSRGNLLTILNPLNQLTGLAYDSHDYLVSLTDPAGSVTSFEYDSSGELVRYRDPMGNMTSFEFNGLAKVIKATDPKGNVMAFGYDASGNMIQKTDANGKKTAYEYNYEGQVTKIIDALNQPTQFTYGTGCPSCGNGVKKLTSLTDAKGNTTVFEYNLAGWQIKETSALGYSKSYIYDASGNLISKQDENGKVTQYSYDPLNRLISIQYADGNITTFGYDLRGNLTQSANQNISYTLTYDLNNRLTGVSDSTGRSILYQYDALGNRVQMTAPDGNTFSYQYDVANRLSQILSPAGTFGFSYDPSGRRTGLSYPSGVKTQYSYDPSGFLTGLMAQVSQGPLINSFAYTQDAMGNRTSMTDISGTHQYTYDAIYQLTRAIHPSGPREQYRYDPVGNRLKKTMDADNRLLEDNNHRYEYDSNGNLTQETNKKTGEVRTFGYDDENRLNVFQDSNTVAEYKYDPFGRRVEKKVNGKVTRYVYDGAHILMEYNEDNKVTSRFVHSLTIDEAVALERGKKVYYYHADGLGSITDLTDAKGNIVKEYHYKSYGALQWQSGSLAQPFRFTGREFDPESGLYYYRARYYNPRMGRFLTKDPIGFMGEDVNLYRYVGNNIINRVDPEGLGSFKTFAQVARMVAESVFGINPTSILSGKTGGEALLRGEQSALLRIYIESDPRFKRADLPSENMYLDTLTNAIVAIREDDKVMIYSQFTRTVVEMDAESFIREKWGWQSGIKANCK